MLFLYAQLYAALHAFLNSLLLEYFVASAVTASKFQDFNAFLYKLSKMLFLYAQLYAALHPILN